jgi:hypothetical protein
MQGMVDYKRRGAPGPVLEVFGAFAVRRAFGLFCFLPCGALVVFLRRWPFLALFLVY